MKVYLPLISLPLAASLWLGSCALQQQASNEPTPQVIHEETELAAPPANTRPRSQLLLDLNPDDLAMIQASTKDFLQPYWPVIAERSMVVRQRIVQTLQDQQAPLELQAVPVIESAYNPYALSYAGALGLWQLMPRTARHLGIKKNKGVDGRRDVERSTQAAATYLMHLREKFGNWPLAIAAYHLGPGAVHHRLHKKPWVPADGLSKMPVPTVTREYVAHVLGLAALLHAGTLSFPEPLATREITIPAPADLEQLAEACEIDSEILFRLNPGLNYNQYLQTDIRLHVPETLAENMLAKLEQARPQTIAIKVRNGDSLWSIAHAHGISISRLKAMNPKAPKLLHIGDLLTVPAKRMQHASATINPLLAHGTRIRYKVRNGDSLWNIAKKFGTTPHAIARINQINTERILRPGDTLWILSRVRPG